MANGIQIGHVVSGGTAQSVAASQTNSQVSATQLLSEADSRLMSIVVAVSDAVVTNAITAKLQDSPDGGTTWRDAGSVSITDVNIQSSLAIEDITYTAVEAGTAGDDITITYVDDGTATAETVDVVGTDITIHMEAGVSTATDIKAAYDAEAAAVALATAAITGTAGDTQSAHAEAPLAGGADPDGVFEIIHNVYDASTDPLWPVARVVVTTGVDDTVTVSQIYLTRRR